MMTKLYNRIKEGIDDLANKNISKNLFMSMVREELSYFFPNRTFKIMDTSDTRYSKATPHIPIMFIEVDKKDGGPSVEYTLLLHVDRIASTDVITPELFIGALSYQIDNMDTLTKGIMDNLDTSDNSAFVHDFQHVIKYYLENQLFVLKYLREQYPHDFSFAMLNGVVPSTAELEALIDRIDFDHFLDIEEEMIKVLDSKYHIPINFLKLVNRVYENHKS